MRADGKDGSPLFARVMLNISRSYYEMEDFDQAGVYYDRAASVDPGLVGSFGYLKSGQGAAASPGSRGAQAGGSHILYAEE